MTPETAALHEPSYDLEFGSWSSGVVPMEPPDEVSDTLLDVCNSDSDVCNSDSEDARANPLRARRRLLDDVPRPNGLGERDRRTRTLSSRYSEPSKPPGPLSRNDSVSKSRPDSTDRTHSGRILVNRDSGSLPFSEHPLQNIPDLYNTIQSNTSSKSISVHCCILSAYLTTI